MKLTTAAAAAATSSRMTIQERNKERMREFVRVVQNEQNVDACDEYFSPKFFNPDLERILQSTTAGPKNHHDCQQADGRPSNIEDVSSGSCSDDDEDQSTINREVDHVEDDKALHRMLFTAFPDMKVSILDMAADGDKVWTYKKFEGTHTGPWLDLPPTNESVSFMVIDIMTMDHDDGMILDHNCVDTFAPMISKLRELRKSQEEEKKEDE